MNFFRNLLLSIFYAAALSAQITVTANVDINRISVNETFGFKIFALNSEEMPQVNISKISKDFIIISGPSQQTNIQWINGKMTSTRAITWTLMPKYSGTLIIPALQVLISKKTYKTQPISIIVEKQNSSFSSNNVFIETEVDKEQAYPGEQVTVTYKLYTNVNISIDNIEFPKSVGFWTENLHVAQTIRFRDVQIQSQPYKVATLYKAALFPTRTGSLSINPMVIIANVEVQQKKRPGALFNDPFFNNMFRETQKKYIQSDTVWITVDDFPPGAAPNFSGAVGEFKLKTYLDTASTKINEAVTFHAEISGTGNLNLFNIPELNFPDYIEAFPPTINFIKDEFRDQITGVFRADYILIPRRDGIFQLPSFDLAYYNPKKSTWETIRSQPLLLTVNPGIGTIASSKFSKQEIELLARDIHYIHNNDQNWNWNRKSTLLLWTWTGYILSTSIFLLPAFLLKTRRGWEAGKDGRRSKQALKNALKLLSQDTKDPFALVTQVLFRYNKEKLFLKSENLDSASLKTELDRKISQELFDELISIIKICDAGRFGPEGATAEISIKNRAREIIIKIDGDLG